MNAQRPAVLPVTNHVYDLLGPVVDDDPDWLALRVLDGLCAAIQESWAIAEQPGLAAYLDPGRAPARWLPAIAQWVGARIRSSQTVDEQRAAIRTPHGWTVGLADHLGAVARQYMTGAARVRVRWRYDPDELGDAPGHFLVRVRAADVPGGAEQQIRDAIAAATPAWLNGHVEISDHQTYDDVRDRHATYDDMADDGRTYDDVLTGDD